MRFPHALSASAGPAPRTISLPPGYLSPDRLHPIPAPFPPAGTSVRAHRVHSTFLGLLILSVSFAAVPRAEAFPLPGDTTRVVLSVDGMHCRSCVSMIRKTLRKLPGVSSVDISLERGTVAVQGPKNAFSPDAAVAAVTRMGYDVTGRDTTGIPMTTPAAAPPTPHR
jgi:copper chaperone CopZ